jgi:hypothetical protein
VKNNYIYIYFTDIPEKKKSLLEGIMLPNGRRNGIVNSDRIYRFFSELDGKKGLS